jgi:cytochrome c oxidase cbb3-type subunit 4
MSYETVVTLSQTAMLVLFILLFAAIAAYALWPSNRARFDEAARVPLERDPDLDQTREPV